MKQKRNLGLSDEEKIEFLARFNYYLLYLKVENHYCNGGVRKVLSIISTILNLSLCGLCLAFLNPITTVMAFTFITAWASTLYAINIVPQASINSMILECSNNKINLQKYYELEKSGEIEKWKEQFKEEILNYDYSKFETSVSEYVANKDSAIIESRQITDDCQSTNQSRQTTNNSKQTNGNER